MNNGYRILAFLLIALFAINACLNLIVAGGIQMFDWIDFVYHLALTACVAHLLAAKGRKPPCNPDCSGQDRRAA
jgi:hypothetical protein